MSAALDFSPDNLISAQFAARTLASPLSKLEELRGLNRNTYAFIPWEKFSDKATLEFINSEKELIAKLADNKIEVNVENVKKQLIEPLTDKFSQYSSQESTEDYSVSEHKNDTEAHRKEIQIKKAYARKPFNSALFFDDHDKHTTAIKNAAWSKILNKDADEVSILTHKMQTISAEVELDHFKRQSEALKFYAENSDLHETSLSVLNDIQEKPDEYFSSLSPQDLKPYVYYLGYLQFRRDTLPKESHELLDKWSVALCENLKSPEGDAPKLKEDFQNILFAANLANYTESFGVSNNFILDSAAIEHLERAYESSSLARDNRDYPHFYLPILQYCDTHWGKLENARKQQILNKYLPLLCDKQESLENNQSTIENTLKNPKLGDKVRSQKINQYQKNKALLDKIYPLRARIDYKNHCEIELPEEKKRDVSESFSWSRFKPGPRFFAVAKGAVTTGVFSAATIGVVSSLLTQEQNEKLFALLPDNIRESTISTLTSACQNVRGNYATYIAAAVTLLVIMAAVLYYNRAAIQQKWNSRAEVDYQPLAQQQAR